MDKGKVILLKDIHQNLIIEKNSIQSIVNSNLQEISKINFFLKSIYENEDANFKVFSPRNTDVIHADEISKNKSRLKELEADNRYHYSILNKIEKFIFNLERVLSDDDCQGSDISDLNDGIRILNFLEQERQRIARDFHDIVLQDTAHLVHMVELCSLYFDTDPVRAKLELESISNNIKSIIESIRNTIFDLRPMTFDDLGFNELLEEFIFKLQERFKIKVVSDIDKITDKKDVFLIAIFRIIKECCINALKHSNCNTLWINVYNREEQKSIEFVIKDDGCGFDTEDAFNKTNHYGLNFLKDRIDILGGTYNISSKINEGTNIHIIIPIREQEDYH